jgi:hypothetical protein
MLQGSPQRGGGGSLGALGSLSRACPPFRPGVWTARSERAVASPAIGLPRRAAAPTAKRCRALEHTPTHASRSRTQPPPCW